MARFPFLFLMALLMGLTIGSAPSQAEPAYPDSYADAPYFHDDLSPYGRWYDLSTYGRVWQPRGMRHGWRPYTQGRWVWDDEYGWTWTSNFAWGWAAFHYGRWIYDSQYGWLWVPGRVWSPAWVTWRFSDGYIGWSPIGIFVNWWSWDPRWDYPGWNYVYRNDFIQPNVYIHVIVRDNYRSYYERTHWHRHTERDNHVVNRPFDRQWYISRSHSEPVRVRVQRDDSLRNRSHQFDGNRLRIRDFNPSRRPPTRQDMQGDLDRQRQQERDQQRQREQQQQLDRQRQLQQQQRQRDQDAARERAHRQEQDRQRQLQQQQLRDRQLEQQRQRDEEAARERSRQQQLDRQRQLQQQQHQRDQEDSWQRQLQRQREQQQDADRQRARQQEMERQRQFQIQQQRQRDAEQRQRQMEQQRQMREQRERQGSPSQRSGTSRYKDQNDDRRHPDNR